MIHSFHIARTIGLIADLVPLPFSFTGRHMKSPASYPRLSSLQYVFLIAAFSASGCAAPPIKPAQPPSKLSVAQVRSELVEEQSPDIADGSQVLWGGVILKAENLTETTQVEVLGFPLDRRQRPLPYKDAQGRFIAEFNGFVEPLELPKGRYITVLGPLTEPVSGTVGEASYQYPVVSITQSHLWLPEELPQRPRITFGFGLSVGN